TRADAKPRQAAVDFLARAAPRTGACAQGIARSHHPRADQRNRGHSTGNPRGRNRDRRIALRSSAPASDMHCGYAHERAPAVIAIWPGKAGRSATCSPSAAAYRPVGPAVLLPAVAAAEQDAPPEAVVVGAEPGAPLEA